jgi:hypothetical protein
MGGRTLRKERRGVRNFRRAVLVIRVWPVLFRSRSVKGRLCRRCIRRTFWRFTPVTLLLGWWGGRIGDVSTAAALYTNLENYIGSSFREPGTRKSEAEKKLDRRAYIEEQQRKFAEQMEKRRQ